MVQNYSNDVIWSYYYTFLLLCHKIRWLVIVLGILDGLLQVVPSVNPTLAIFYSSLIKCFSKRRVSSPQGSNPWYDTSWPLSTWSAVSCVAETWHPPYSSFSLAARNFKGYQFDFHYHAYSDYVKSPMALQEMTFFLHCGSLICIHSS